MHGEPVVIEPQLVLAVSLLVRRPGAHVPASGPQVVEAVPALGIGHGSLEVPHEAGVKDHLEPRERLAATAGHPPRKVGRGRETNHGFLVEGVGLPESRLRRDERCLRPRELRERRAAVGAGDGRKRPVVRPELESVPEVGPRRGRVAHTVRDHLRALHGAAVGIDDGDRPLGGRGERDLPLEGGDIDRESSSSRPPCRGGRPRARREAARATPRAAAASEACSGRTLRPARPSLPRRPGCGAPSDCPGDRAAPGRRRLACPISSSTRPRTVDCAGFDAASSPCLGRPREPGRRNDRQGNRSLSHHCWQQSHRPPPPLESWWSVPATDCRSRSTTTTTARGTAPSPHAYTDS